MTKNPIAERPLVLKAPGMNDIPVQHDIVYARAPSRELTMDLYRPPQDTITPLAAIILATGYSDVLGAEMLGCKLKEMAAYVGWAQLLACAGLVAITYESEEPVRDLEHLIDHVRANASRLQIDASRLGIWSCSGNVPNALATLEKRDDLICGAFCYGYMTSDDADGRVADAARQFGFVLPRPVIDMSRLAHKPVLVARAGRDEMPGLNASLDRFVSAALERNLPVTVINHAAGPHAFDVFDPSPGSRAAIEQTVGFLRAHLRSLDAG